MEIKRSFKSVKKFWDSKLSSYEDDLKRKRQLQRFQNQSFKDKMNRLKSDYLNHEIAQYIMTFSQYKKPSVRKKIFKNFSIKS